jgi:hypothetical protein
MAVLGVAAVLALLTMWRFDLWYVFFDVFCQVFDELGCWNIMWSYQGLYS